MGRKLVPLGAETLDLVPEPCRRCVFWELGAKARPRGSEDAALQKEAWLSSVVLEWGPAGHVVSVDGEVAEATRCPHASAGAGRGSEAARPVSRDAVLLATLAVGPGSGGRGVLLQTMAPRPDQAQGAGGGGVRDRADPARLPRPAGFLEASGFQVVRDHPRYPLMRMDLRTALTWKDAREAAREALGSRPRRAVPCGPSPPRAPRLRCARTAVAANHERVPTELGPGYGTSPTQWVGLAGWILGWVGQPMNSESSVTMLRLGMAPISRFFSTPPMNSARVGMLMTP